MVHYKIIVAQRKCDIKIYTRVRPGCKEYTITRINPETFDIDQELQKIKFEIKAPWNNTLSPEVTESYE